MIPLPCVTGVFMNAMFVWSPGPRSASASASASFDGRRALTGEGGLVDVERVRLDDPAVGGHVVAGGEQHDVADDDLLGRDRASTPSRRTRAVCFVIDFERVHRALGLALLAEADDGVQHRQQQQQAPVLHSPMASDTTPAMSRMICM